MADNTLFPVPKEVAERAWVDNAKYQEMYKRSIDDPVGFWNEHGKRINWIKPYTKVKNTTFTGKVSIKWYEDGTLNACANCVEVNVNVPVEPSLYFTVKPYVAFAWSTSTGTVQ